MNDVQEDKRTNPCPWAIMFSSSSLLMEFPTTLLEHFIGMNFVDQPQTSYFS